MGKKIVVMLGMHRSGTSAITRGLAALGVELGNSFIHTQEDNPKGYWEDADINALNIEALKELGLDWNSLRPLKESDFSSAAFDSLEPRALDVLRGKMADVPVFGFKDPRTTRLLPFWKRVFDDLNLEVGYIIASRNPLSVAKSLATRNGFPHGITYALWLVHQTEAMINTEKTSRIVVDYDLFLDNPLSELKRIGEFFSVGEGVAMDSPKVKEFIDSFLDKGLRHASHQTDDMLNDSQIIEFVVEAFDRLSRMARREIDPNSPSEILYWRDLSHKIAVFSPVFAYFDKMDAMRKEFEIAMRTEFDTTIAERDSRIASLENKISDLNWTISVRDEQIAAYENHVRDLNQTIADMLASTSWKVTRPMRESKRLFETYFKRS